MTKKFQLFSVCLTIMALTVGTFPQRTKAETVTIPFKEAVVVPVTGFDAHMFDLKCTVKANSLAFALNAPSNSGASACVQHNNTNSHGTDTKLTCKEPVEEQNVQSNLLFGASSFSTEVTAAPTLTIDLGTDGCYTCTGSAIDSAYASGGNCQTETASSSAANTTTQSSSAANTTTQSSSAANEKSSVYSSVSGAVTLMFAPLAKLISAFLLLI